MELDAETALGACASAVSWRELHSRSLTLAAVRVLELTSKSCIARPKIASGTIWSISLFIFKFFGPALLSSTEDAGAVACVFALPVGHILGCLLVVFSRT